MTNPTYTYLSPSEMRIITESPLINTNYLSYTLEEHKIENIVNYFKGNGRVTAVKQPFGFNQGYAAYMDYSTRKSYWDEYEHTLWMGSEYVRGLFNNDETRFHHDFCQKIKDCHDKALLEVAGPSSPKRFGLFVIPKQIPTTDKLDKPSSLAKVR